MSTDMFPDSFIKYELDYRKGFAAAVAGYGALSDDQLTSLGYMTGFSDGVDAQLKEKA